MTLAALVGLTAAVASSTSDARPIDFCSKHPNNPNCQTTSSTTTTVPTTTTIPPPTGTWGSGLSIIKLGSASFSGLPGLSNYQIYLGGPNQIDQVTSQTGKAILYVNGMTIPDVPWSNVTGVTIEAARANGWILKDAAGGEVYYQGCPPNSYQVLPDVGNPDYQQAYITAVKGILNDHPGVEGIWIDDVKGSRQFPCTESVKYPDDVSYRNAVLSFMRAIYPAFHAINMYVSVNASINECQTFSCGNPPQQCNGDEDAWWDRQLSAYVDGITMERFMQSNTGIRRKEGTSCFDYYSQALQVVSATESGGDDFLPIDSTNDTDGTATYTRASFLLETTRPSSAFTWACGGNGVYSASCDPLAADGGVWARSMGAPLGTKTVLTSDAQKRLFENGEAIVNPTGVQVIVDGHTIAAGSAYIGP